MPELPLALEKRLIREYSLSTEAAKIISADKNMAAWFDRIIAHTKNYKAVSNWIIGPVKSFLNENNSEIEAFPISSESMASLVDLVEEGKVSFGIACSRIFPVLLDSGEKEPFAIAKELNLLQEKNGDTLQQWIDDVLSSMPDKVLEYKKGKKNLTGLFAGEVKKKSRGKADMKAVIELLNQKLNQ